ncbi:MAG: hypothetical protein IJ246_11520 [Clostridia bacterium]|nr:hypothetical protein [Clostridia bacterium]
MIYQRNTRVPRWVPYVVAVLLFISLLTAYLTFLPSEPFVDETDVFSVGDEIARGGDVYKVNISQHMPFSYYIAAVMGLTHPVNIMAYRLYFYVLMSLGWSLLYLHMRKHLNPVALILLPFLYLMTLSLYDLCTTMLSEHWAGFGHAVMLMELLAYMKNRRLSWSSCVWLSLSIVLTFGCIFTSAYAVFLVALGVVIFQAWMISRAGVMEKKQLRRQVIADDGKLVVCCLIPWVILIAWYAVSGNLQNFFYGAYFFNTQIYSKYMGGLGTDPLGSFLLTYRAWWDYTIRCVKGALGIPTVYNELENVEKALQWMRFFDGAVRNLAPLCLGAWLLTQSPIIAVTFVVSTIAVGIRGYDHYHAMNFMCATELSLALLLGSALRAPWGHWKKWTRYPGAMAAVGILVIYVLHTEVFPQFPMVPQYVRSAHLFERNVDSEDIKTFTDIILDPGDTVHMTGLENGGTVEVDRGIDYGAACSTPWTWEGYGEKEMQTLRENRTKMLFYSYGGEVWGYYQDEYARELVSYIRDNYYQAGTEMFIRRDYMGEAIRRTFAADYSGYFGVDTFEDPIALYEGSISGYVPIAPVPAVQLYTPAQREQLELILFTLQDTEKTDLSDIVAAVTEAETGHLLWALQVPGDYLAPGEENMVFLENVILEEGVTYRIQISCANPEKTPVALGTGTPGGAFDTASEGLSSGEGWAIRLSVAEPYETWEDYSYEDYAWEEETYDDDWTDEEADY